MKGILEVEVELQFVAVIEKDAGEWARKLEEHRDGGTNVVRVTGEGGVPVAGEEDCGESEGSATREVGVWKDLATKTRLSFERRLGRRSRPH